MTAPCRFVYKLTVSLFQNHRPKYLNILTDFAKVKFPSIRSPITWIYPAAHSVHTPLFTFTLFT
jgi:hypothetical protein